MISNWIELGSMVIDVNGAQLDAIFLNSAGAVRDRFSIQHQSVPTTPPAAPGALSVISLSSSEIALTWQDNSNNEDSFHLERSLDQVNWSSVTSVGANTVSFVNTGLDPETLYYYRVIAVNIFGNSASSNVVGATTDAQADFVDYYATADSPVNGTVAGSFGSTSEDDGNAQSITESVSGGKPSKRRSLLEHRWQFNVQPGTTATLMANAWSSGSADNDSFRFSYSANGGSSWQDVFTISSTDTQHSIAGTLPASASGTVLIRVIDTDRTQGNSAPDTVFIDELRIRVSLIAGNPPADPSNLMFTLMSNNVVNLTWTDNATDELGYELERQYNGGSWSLVDTLSADAVSATDTPSQGGNYAYQVRAYNASGQSGYSESAFVTIAADSITLTASGQKIKGFIYGNLTWANTAEQVDIYRNGAVVATITGNSHTDNTGEKGGGTFIYQICETVIVTNCSNTVTVSF